MLSGTLDNMPSSSTVVAMDADKLFKCTTFFLKHLLLDRKATFDVLEYQTCLQRFREYYNAVSGERSLSLADRFQITGTMPVRALVYKGVTRGPSADVQSTQAKLSTQAKPPTQANTKKIKLAKTTKPTTAASPSTQVYPSTQAKLPTQAKPPTQAKLSTQAKPPTQAKTNKTKLAKPTTPATVAKPTTPATVAEPSNKATAKKGRLKNAKQTPEENLLTKANPSDHAAPKKRSRKVTDVGPALSDQTEAESHHGRPGQVATDKTNEAAGVAGGSRSQAGDDDGGAESAEGVGPATAFCSSGIHGGGDRAVVAKSAEASGTSEVKFVVHFLLSATDLTFGKDAAVALVKSMRASGFGWLFLVTVGSITLHAARELQAFCPFEVWPMKTCLMPAISHYTFSPHRVLTARQKKKFYEKWKISAAQVPRVVVTDPAVKYYGLVPGDVVEIQRNTYVGVITSYRVVVHAAT